MQGPDKELMGEAHLSTQPAAPGVEHASQEDLFGGLNVAHESAAPHGSQDSLI